MASYTQIEVHRENGLPLIMTFTNQKEARSFETWLIMQRRKFVVHDHLRLMRTEAEAIAELEIWER